MLSALQILRRQQQLSERTRANCISNNTLTSVSPPLLDVLNAGAGSLRARFAELQTEASCISCN